MLYDQLKTQYTVSNDQAFDRLKLKIKEQGEQSEQQRVLFQWSALVFTLILVTARMSQMRLNGALSKELPEIKAGIVADQGPVIEKPVVKKNVRYYWVSANDSKIKKGR